MPRESGLPLLDDVLANNARFVQKPHRTLTGMPAKNVVIFTCMDTRLVDFLEPAMGVERGDATVIKNAGITVLNPIGSVIRSLAVAIYAQHCDEIFVIGHLDCGMTHLDLDSIRQRMVTRGVPETVIESLQPSLGDWFGGFPDADEHARDVAHQLRDNPLIPTDVPVHCLMFDPASGELEVIEQGYAAE